MTSKIKDWYSNLSLKGRFCLDAIVMSAIAGLAVWSAWDINQERFRKEGAKTQQVETAWSEYADALQDLSAAKQKINLYCPDAKDTSDLCTTAKYNYQQLKYKTLDKANQLKSISASPELVDRLMNDYK